MDFILADQYKALKDLKAKKEDELKDVKERIDDIEKKLVEAMTDEELQNFTRDGMTFYLNPKIFVSAKADSKIELYDALKENGFGDMVQETVNANSFASFVREQMAENGDTVPDWLDGLVNIHEETKIGTRKAK